MRNPTVVSTRPEPADPRFPSRWRTHTGQQEPLVCPMQLTWLSTCFAAWENVALKAIHMPTPMNAMISTAIAAEMTPSPASSNLDLSRLWNIAVISPLAC